MDSLEYTNMSAEELRERILELEVLLNEEKREKEKMFSMISHDIKSPFNRIYALTNLFFLEEDQPTDVQRDYIQRIQQSVRDGLLLVRNLMDLRAIEGKGIEVILENLDLNRLMYKIIDSFKQILERKDIDIQISSDPEMELFLFDKHYLTRIVENVLGNAIKYSPNGETVCVSIHQVEKEMCRIEVVDKGKGIPAEEHKDLFKKFRVLSTKPTGGESGSGLGLYIAWELLNKMESSIVVDSSPEKGTRVVLDIKAQ